MSDAPLLPPQRPTYYEDLRERGYSRRDFLKFCTTFAAYMGLEASGIAQVTRALETQPRLPVVWLHFQECTCCSESFLRADNPIVADILLDQISLEYSQTLMAAAGFQAESTMFDSMKKYKGEYILCVEGSIPTGEHGVYCMSGGRTALQLLEEAAEGAKAIIAWGSCASHGCVQAAKPNPTGATPVKKLIKNKPIINVPGCPPIGEVMAGVIVHIVTFGTLPELDAAGRPRAFYSRRVHNACSRREAYIEGLFVESFDDENAKKGYCLYKVGCKGPFTYNACSGKRWNGGVGNPVQAGHGCIGCAEENFWDRATLYTLPPEAEEK